MQQKLKSVFRRSSRSRASSGQHESNSHPPKASPPRGDRRRTSSDRHGRTSVDSSATGSVYVSRSRPVSSIYDELQHRTRTEPNDLASPTDPNGGAIANDYKAYLPVLSPVNDDYGDDYMTLGENMHCNTRRSESRHEEDVADRNIARYSSSFDGGHRRAPSSNLTSAQQGSRKQPSGAGSAGATLSPVQTGGSVGKYSIGQDIVRKGDWRDGVHSITGPTTHEGSSRKRSSLPPGSARVDTGVERKPLASGSNTEASPSMQGTHDTQGSHAGMFYATVDGERNGEETALARNLRKDGVADLRSTVDTDGDITWAPAVTHEVVKPHRHEIVQHKVYREIHNYEYFHRIQPVMMTEVLPPRHWIPNPDGEGLIEITADELPARTGDNRWWSICEHSNRRAPQTTLPKYRTEPEIIEAGTFITKEGFERKETIIIHPPTLADLTGYGGPVQAMHFDHKTGESWMGELTTMDKLEQLQQELDRAPDAQVFKMDGLTESLPNVLNPDRRGSTSVPPRKPVSGHTSSVHGSNIGHKTNAV
ncbi:hypothetical protein SVAN01_03192 [Stagonosporopsis vannaccii]|nr:hypothetical protein SVAN01_03192 [Stagonosporopsis vannaccii]